MALYAEIAEEECLSIPMRRIEKIWSKAGMRFNLLAEEETQFDEGSLLLQQQTLKHIWDSKEENVYEL